MSRKAIVLTALAISIAATGLILWMRHGEYWKIDACLDRGGAWQYGEKRCRH